MSDVTKLWLFFIMLMAGFQMMVRFGKKPASLDQQAKEAAEAKGRQFGEKAIKRWLSR